MQIGDRLNQRYTLTAHLGSGAMGDVYQATDSQTSQTVAVKALDRKLTLDPDMVERFRREGEALRQLRHRHIVSFIDTFQHEGQQVIVMECVSGGNLHQLIKRGPLPVEQTCRLTLELCDALTQAHHLQIVHRDIKPENVLMSQDGTPKLTDFGLARLVSEGTRLTGTGTQIGTPFYMSPEAWQGQPLDAQADIWSLGILLYEMLTGDVPFGGDTLIAVMNQVLTAPLPDLKKLRPETPPALVKIVRRMLERDKTRRYQSVRQVAVDVEQVTAAPTATAPVGGAITRPYRPPVGARMPGLSPLGWVVVAAVVGVIICVVGASSGPLGAKLRGRATQTLPASPLPRATQLAPATATVRLRPTGAPPTNTPPPPETPVRPTPPPGNNIGDAWPSLADGMTLLYVPAGDFLMGSTDSDSQADGNEKPQHTVYLDAFWIDQTEVTQGMYAKCVVAGKCDKAMCSVGGDNHPAICVNRNDAENYCAWARRRLPTEAEWEKAARGADGRLYPWGNQAPNETLANFNQNVKETTDVGKYPAGASPYGALDMAGNLFEWVADWYAADYYQYSPSRNPAGPETERSRVLRGGSWNSKAEYVRAAMRTRDQPIVTDYNYGFRCAASASPTAVTPQPNATPTPLASIPLPRTILDPDGGITLPLF
jgi:formylglycine-generating enzyme required for sulfatase activity